MKKKYKEYHFDVEYIHDMDVPLLQKKQTISTHRIYRGLTLKQLNELIKLNMIPEEKENKITLNIRAVNY